MTIGFAEGKCDNACALNVMERANIPSSNFKHLTSLNMIFLNQVTNDQLQSLRRDTDHVAFIECDSCITTQEYAPVCGNNGKTYSNRAKLNCDNKCHNTSEKVKVAHDGECKNIEL